MLIEENVWYLSILGVLPAFQGQGLGDGLVESILEKTDQLAVSTYLETFNPRNITFYNRMGYRVATRFDEPVTDADYRLLTRETMLQNRIIPYIISNKPTAACNIRKSANGTEALTLESRATDDPRNTNVAKPAAIPKHTSCCCAYPLSIALAANRLVQKTIVRGLEAVNKNADMKLAI